MPTQMLKPAATAQSMMRLSVCSNVSTLKMDAVHFSETSVSFCHTARRLISEDSTPHLCSKIQNIVGDLGISCWILWDILVYGTSTMSRATRSRDGKQQTHRKVPRLAYFARRRTGDHETFRGRATFVAGRCPCASSTCVLLQWHKTIKLVTLNETQNLAVLMRDIFTWFC
jgi:hypothetical protein